MNNRFSYLSILLLFISLPIYAQTTDFGIWTHVGIEKKFDKLTLESNAELRTKDHASTTDRWSVDLGASYKLFKPLTVGVAYEFILYNDTKYNDMQPRQRYIAFAQGSQKFGNFTLSLRERFQRTVKDESDRITTSGGYDTYKINPELVWRNRIKLAYDIPQCRLSPSYSFETFYQLNNPDGNQFNKLRHTLSFDYKLTKHHQLELFGLMDREINVNSPLTKLVAGCGYKFSF